ncbi:sialidase family protein [Membranihabitans marinus]|uniref:sialidase family protein n=1 Tax=Membranihabitans marinus TaxID=1227546 RepID=UPI001F34D662|nr:sialidase family protein [Membranihabitans marinus]
MFSVFPKASFAGILGGLPPWVQNNDTTKYQIISKGGEAGEYQAFPDACKLKNGDILAVFYGGYGHVSYPNEGYPNAGRICMVRSKDEGKTWSKPITIFDDIYDNRDPHISQLNDGTIMVSFFSLNLKSNPKSRTGVGVQFIQSFDNGYSWTERPRQVSITGTDWYCSAPIREMSNGTLVFPVYKQVLGSEHAWGGVFLSYDKGKSWTDPIAIGEEAELFLAAETDVVRLNDGTLLAALRGQKELPMHYSISNDVGKSWSEVQSIGFLAHSPHFNRLTTGEILMTYRGVEGSETFDWDKAYTALRISYDEGKSWQGPFKMDESRGAYPATVELSDGNILLIFYEEGENSGVGALKFEMPDKSYHLAPVAQPINILEN